MADDSVLSKEKQKKIREYQELYAQAKSAGDYAGMEAANKGANIERGLGGVVTAKDDIDAVRSQYADGGENRTQTYAADEPSSGPQDAPSGSGGAGAGGAQSGTQSAAQSAYTPLGSYDDRDMTAEDRAKIAAFRQQWADATARGDTAAAEAAHAGAEAVRAQYMYSGGADGSQYIGLANAGQPVKQAAARLPSETPAEDYINSAQSASVKSAEAALKTAYDRNTAAVDEEAAKVAPYYRDAENAASGQYEIAQRSMNERAAASGLGSGAGTQAALSMANQYQGNVSALEQAKAAALTSIRRERTALYTQYQDAIAEAVAEGDAERAKELYEDYVRVDRSKVETAYRQAELDGQTDRQYSSDLETRRQESAANAKTAKKDAQNQVDALIRSGIMPPDSLIEAAGYDKEGYVIPLVEKAQGK